VIVLLLLLVSSAEASTLILPESPPAPAAILRGELHVAVVDQRPPEQRSQAGAVLIDAHDPLVLAGDLSARIRRLGEAAVRSEGGWAGEGGPTLTLTLRSFLCSAGRTPTCTLVVEASWGDAGAFALISAVGAGPPDLSTAATQAVDRLSARLRTALQDDSGFAEALAATPAAVPERPVAVLRWTEGDHRHAAELVQEGETGWCVGDADGLRRLQFEAGAVDITRAEVRARADQRWVLAADVDGNAVSGAFEGALMGGVVVHTGTRRRLLMPSEVSTLFVSPDRAGATCPEDEPPAPDGDALLLVDAQGRALGGIHFDFDRGMAQSTHARAVRRSAPDEPLTLNAFLNAVGSETLRLRHVQLAERLRKQERGGQGMAALGGGFLALAGGLTAYALVTSGVNKSPPEYGSPGTALALALPLASIAGPILGGGLHAQGAARAKRLDLDAGHLELLRSPRDVWLAVQAANEGAR
jgi:hypothetical protein